MTTSRPPKGSGVFHLPYSKLTFSPLTDYAPIVDARLSWNGASTTVWMLMDTGATMTVLPRWIAEELDLPMGGSRHSAKGVGGRVSVRPSKVHLQLVTKDTTGRTGSSWLLDPVMVTESDDVVPIALLGRKPFLQHHELTVRESKQEFVLRELR